MAEIEKRLKNFGQTGTRDLESFNAQERDVEHADITKYVTPGFASMLFPLISTLSATQRFSRREQRVLRFRLISDNASTAGHVYWTPPPPP
jgi:hypothetical protein